MTVELEVDDTLTASWDAERIEALVESIVRRQLPGCDPYTISLHLVGDDAIQALNASYRDKNTPTDVLSFPLHDTEQEFVLPPNEPVNLGDVVVSYQRAAEQAAQFGHSVDRELAYLVAHGVLHVLGYDHEVEAEREHMRRLEEEALEPLGFTR